ncbi:MAG: 1,4-beta-xylanase, partial [Bacteroidota bacterium]|nr:1,4-beta-xylanase [Bacteroidota bacterium]
MKRIFLALLVGFSLLNIAPIQAKGNPVMGKRWTNARANEWYKQWGWLRGCDFIPSSAINQLEMWQKETFDPATIDRELGYAQSIGMNVMRVYLHHLAWEIDPS